MQKRIHLNIKRSSIHGKGLFSASNISAGSLIGIFKGVKTKRRGAHVLWVCFNRKPCFLRVHSIVRYANHSESPNAQLIGFNLYALEHIKKNTEITFDYRG